MTERMTAADLRAFAARSAGQGKGRVRGTQRVEVDGITFDSKREAARWCELRVAERGGAISNLRRQVKIPLIGQDGPILTPTGQPMHYVADFAYRDVETGEDVVEDSKGHPTDTYRMKRAILAAQGVEVREV